MTNRVKRVTEAPEGEWLTIIQSQWFRFTWFTTFQRVYERIHKSVSPRGTKEREIYKQMAHLILIRIPLLYGRRSGIERAHTEQHVRNHRSQPDSDSSSRLFSLLQNSDSPLDSPLTPCHNSMPRTSTFQPNLVFHKMKNRVRVKFIGRRNKERK